MRLSEERRRKAVLGLQVAGVVALAVLVGTLSGESAHALGDPLGSSCSTTANGYLNPAWISTGGQVNVRSLLRFSCPDRQHAYHLVLVVDVAALAANGEDPGASGHLLSLLDRLETDHNPRAWAGLVGYGPGDSAQLLCPVTGDIEGLKTCVGRSIGSASTDRPGPSSGLGEGIREGTKALVMARRADPERRGDDPLEEGLLVVGWARPDLDCSANGPCPACAQARSAREAGIEVSSACLGGQCTTSCLSLLPSSPDVHYGPGELDRAKDDQADRAWATELRVRTATVYEQLGDEIALQEDSLDPSGAEYDREKHEITWKLDAGRQTESTLAYAAIAEQPGRWLIRFGHGIFADSLGQRGNFLLPEKYVAVTDRDIVQIMLPWLSSCSGDTSHTFALTP